VRTPEPWLVVVDVQRCFTTPGEEWYAHGAEDLSPKIVAMMAVFHERTVATRFVSEQRPQGAWADYYRRWPKMQLLEDHPSWDLDPEIRSALGDNPVCTGSGFSKWAEVRRVVPADAPLVICGVATEACVLSTVLDAVEAGRRVSLLEDLCRGSTSALHEAAIAVMETFSPMVRVSSSSQLRWT
jgi:nicotinamidase-related amidase